MRCYVIMSVEALLWTFAAIPVITLDVGAHRLLLHRYVI